MEIEGIVHNGVIEFEPVASLPEGTRVTLTPCEPPSATSAKPIPSIFDRYQSIIGIAPDELAEWLGAFRQRQATLQPADAWLEQARGPARSGVSTAEIMQLTRGDD